MIQEREPFMLTAGKATGVCLIMTFVILTTVFYIQAGMPQTVDGHATREGGLVIMIGVILVIAFWIWIFTRHFEDD